MRRRGRYSGKGESVPGLVLLVVLVCTCGSTAKGADPNQPSAIDSMLAAVHDCMARRPAPWPEPWTQEYLNTIRQAVAAKPDASEYARRMQILQDGFALYWPQLKNTRERSSYEVRRAEIRWYVENLMAADLPDEEERQAIRRQYEELTGYAVESLSIQFSFLDPNMVSKAKADPLAEHHRNIDAPLVPIYLTRLSKAQMGQMKQCWHDLRYARVDLWRQLGRGPQKPSQEWDTSLGENHPDYILAQQSLPQLGPHTCTIVAPSPDYYCAAIANEVDSQTRRLQAWSQARTQEAHLSNAMSQTEYISFLLGALLETPACFQASNMREITPFEPQ